MENGLWIINPFTENALPDGVRYIINKLNENNFEAYIVGGCVRDIILGKEPNDWDICTSALPSEIKKIFLKERIIETGLNFGTIIINYKGLLYDVTTFRKDGEYKNNRHPKTVEYVINLHEDLSRRDFAINALAYHPQKGLIDLFNGVNDLKKKIICCVGIIDDRFKEDSLRILRALRFASVYNFSIENHTSEAIFKNKDLLKNISIERISIELNKLILGDGAGRIINEYFSVITVIIPELRTLPRYIANHLSIDHAPKNLPIRLALLFIDFTYKRAEIALKRLKYSNEMIKTVTELIQYHRLGMEDGKWIMENVPVAAEFTSVPYPDITEIYIKKLLNRIGIDRFKQLLELKKALAKAQNQNLTHLSEISLIFDKILNEQSCFSLKQLVINGKDLFDIGITDGKEIGNTLNQILEMVIEEKIENDKDIIMKFLQAKTIR